MEPEHESEYLPCLNLVPGQSYTLYLMESQITVIPGLGTTDKQITKINLLLPFSCDVCGIIYIYIYGPCNLFFPISM